MSYVDTLREIEELRKSIHQDQIDLTNPDLSFKEREEIEYRRNSNIQKLGDLLQQGPLEAKKAWRASDDKVHDDKAPKRICVNCQTLIKEHQQVGHSGYYYWHLIPTDCVKKS